MQAVQKYGSFAADTETTAASGSTLNDQAALFRVSTACSNLERGLEKVT